MKKSLAKAIIRKRNYLKEHPGDRRSYLVVHPNQHIQVCQESIRQLLQREQS